ncbi:dioxygenase family protein [Arsenicibacter rosenii]|uniref:Intradiol ring-cleavage dioxygenase n=1 Tax=Arsenicibacter rosenii TaxID=1750698 RepID=A0A1S2VQR1_9BACT|nr:intradiol ring-cleavage dioxygenase [Arsenicibacter rosenii]OIN61127.1 intradiol ring-cleavage dioxygenase [Arsenicibacter rosenii]
MDRKDFLKKGFTALGISMVMPLTGCKKSEVDAATTSGTGTGTSTGTTTGNCTVTPSETEGPFPTKTPSSLVLTDIRSDRTGVPFTIKITIQNKNAGCAVLKGALVDIWHCDKDGYYSEYGGTGMQSANFTSVHFLRGRQTTDASGLVSFTSIFPGWYSGRAPHIHVHIYDSTGKSLLVTQIAFPKDVCDTVYTTATTFYTRGKQDTTNERDNVFSDGFTTELATVTGSVSAGYVLTHTIVVSA